MKKCRIFWTCVLPEHLIAQYGLSFAACNFSFNLMSGGAFDKVYSSMPLYVGGNMPNEAFGDERFELVYNKWRKKRGIWQKLATFREQFTIFRQIPKYASIWLYNINTLNALLFVLLKLLKPSVQLNIIVLDFTPVNKGFGLNKIYLKLINWAHGRICLANSDLFKKENSMILPGVVPSNSETNPTIQSIKKSFLLSGVLSEEISMLSVVLEAFSKLPECDLHITGNKGNELLIQQYAKKYSNIHWHGQLPFKDYLNLLHSITFQLSTRDITFPENQCNFPSKIIEALYHNRIVISTIHYPQLDGIRYFEVRPTLNEFIDDIRNISSMSEDDLMKYTNQEDDVRSKYSVEVWNECMTTIENSK